MALSRRNSKAKKVLVTGSHGFLGGAFVDFLKKKNIAYVRYDKSHPEELELDFDSVVHFGGLTPMSEVDKPIAPEDYYKANVEGTEQLLKIIALNKHLKRFVNIGSTAEYGLHPNPITEDARERPVSDYGKSKLAQSKLVEHFAKERKIRAINLRIFNIAGLAKRSVSNTNCYQPTIFESLTAQFTKNFKGVVEVNNASAVRDFVDLEDVLQAVFCALNTKKGGTYEIINICSGKGVSLAHLAELFGLFFKKKYRLKEKTKKRDRATGVPRKAKKILGWEAKIGLQASIRKLFSTTKRVVIIGAGVAGHDTVKEIEKEGRSDIVVIGFVDDDETKQGRRIRGVEVIGTIRDLQRIVQEHSVDHVFISTPSVGKELVTRVTDLLPAGFPIKVLPSISSVLLGKVDLSYVRDIDISDLVGRPLIKSDQQHISSKARKKTFLVTGGAGSIGGEIVRQLHSTHAARIVVVDAWEEGMFNLSEELEASNGLKHPEIQMCIGNIRDKKRMTEILKKWKPDAIFHAAAYKHVPLMEANPDEAYKTNYIGTKNLLDLAIEHKIKEFVFISTDKAVNPKSVLGATKRAGELLVKAYAQKYPNSRLCAVRFGNVLHSSGSVIPTFLRQIRNRSTVTITHRDMTRYFMSIPEAVSLVLSSWVVAKNGQILILDMGEPVKILDLAIHLIKMHGLEPHKDIQIEEIGIRPGEKIHEELAYNKDLLKPSPMPRIFIAEELS